MEDLLGQEWEIVPAGGATGEAFFARCEDQELFLKRNSSPFLAVLSAEGIVPKLVWTKRLENGDVISAQQWLTGRELKAPEMNQDRVAKLLRKIHRSKPMLGMLRRLGKVPLQPENLLEMATTDLDAEIIALPEVQKALAFVRKEADSVQSDEQVVCHGDLNHNNWLLAENNQLYLIDWDGAMVADPAIDLGQMLYWYIPESDWDSWMDVYGKKITSHLKLRMKWYVTLQSLSSIQWNKNRGRFQEMERLIEFLAVITNHEN